MSATTAPGSTEYLAWMDVGEPPASVMEWKNARLKRLTPIFAAVSAVIFGPIVGFIAIVLWPGAQVWSLTGRLELFGVVGAVVAVADYATTLRLLPWMVTMSTLHIRRVAIGGGKLHIEPTTGRLYDFPLDRLGVSHDPVAGGWYSIGLNYGKVTATMFIPEPVHRAIVASRPSAK